MAKFSFSSSTANSFIKFCSQFELSSRWFCVYKCVYYTVFSKSPQQI